MKTDIVLLILVTWVSWVGTSRMLSFSELVLRDSKTKRKLIFDLLIYLVGVAHLLLSDDYYGFAIILFYEMAATIDEELKIRASFFPIYVTLICSACLLMKAEFLNLKLFEVGLGYILASSSILVTKFWNKMLPSKFFLFKLGFWQVVGLQLVRQDWELSTNIFIYIISSNLGAIVLSRAILSSVPRVSSFKLIFIFLLGVSALWLF